MLATHFDFLKESLRTMRTTGAIMRSSKHLVREMMRPIDFQRAKILVELGAGDGVLTYEILDRMSADARLLVFEINPEFCKILRGSELVNDPRFMLIEDSAETLPEHLQRLGIGEVDYIVSAIPFIALPDALVHRIVEVCRKALKMNGLFIQFHYSLLIKKMYQRIFGNVETAFVPLNMPPAFVMRCVKK